MLKNEAQLDLSHKKTNMGFFVLNNEPLKSMSQTDIPSPIWKKGYGLDQTLPTWQREFLFLQFQKTCFDDAFEK